MRQPNRLVLRLASVISIALCAWLLLQSVGIAPPAGLSWGDGVRGRAYAVAADGAIIVQTLSGVKNPPPNCIISFTREGPDALGFHFYRTNLIVLAQDRTPLPGIYAKQTELRIAMGWPMLLSVLIGSLCLSNIVKERRAARTAHHCRNCGYDLRATPARCPECGLVPRPHPREPQ